MSKAKLLPPEWSSIAEWCEEVGVNQSLSFMRFLNYLKTRRTKVGSPILDI